MQPLCRKEPEQRTSMTSETQQTLPLLACMTCSMLLFPGIWLMQRRRLTDATKWNITVNHLTASMVLVAANALARLILAGGPLHTWPEGVNDFVIIMLKTLGGLAAVNLALLGMGHRIRLRELLLVSGWMGGLLLPMLSAIQSANGPSPMPDPAGLAGFILPGATTAMALSLLTRSGDTRGETTSKQGTLEGLLMATGWIGLLGSHLCAAGFPIQEIRNQLFLSLTGAMPVLIIVSCLSRSRDASSSMPLTGALLLGAAGIIKGGIVPGLMLGALGALLDVVLEGLIHRFPEKRAWSTGGLLTALSSVSVLAMTGSLKELPGQLTLVVFTLLLSGPSSSTTQPLSRPSRTNCPILRSYSQTTTT